MCAEVRYDREEENSAHDAVPESDPAFASALAAFVVVTVFEEVDTNFENVVKKRNDVNLETSCTKSEIHGKL